MTIKDLSLLSTESGVFLKRLKDETKPFYNPETSLQYEPEKHAVKDATIREDRLVQYDEPTDPDDPDSELKTVRDWVAVNRNAVALQKLIVKRAVAFLTNGGVILEAKKPDEAGQKTLDAVNDTWSENKMRFKLGEIARTIMTQQECAVLCYRGTDGTRIKIHKPADGFTFYPVWDEEGGMIAFGIGWEAKGEDYSEVIRLYTAGYIYRYERSAGDIWTQKEAKINAVKKVPIAYFPQPEVEWADVQDLIERFETAFNNESDTNDYTADPTMAATGTVKGIKRKGPSSSVVELEEGGDLKYLASPNMPDSVEHEQSTLLRLIYTITQTPDISFEAMKALTQISGTALDLMFTDAHLKAQEKQEGAFGEGVQRLVNLFKAFALKDPNIKGAKDIRIEPKFQRFSLTSEEDRINLAMKASGKSVASQRKGIEMSGVTDDADAMLQEIQDEEKDATPAQKKIGFQQV